MAAVSAIAQRQRGFTLLEMLAVITLIGILSAAAVLSVSGNSARRLHGEGERLQQALQMAADEAVFQGTMLGVTLTQSGYGFVRYDQAQSKWQEVGEGALRNYTLSQDLHLGLTLQKPVKLPPDMQAGASAPALLFLSSGEMTPFTISLSVAQEPPLTLSTDGLAPIALSQKEVP